MRNHPEPENQPERQGAASPGARPLPLTDAEARTLRDAVERLIGRSADPPRAPLAAVCPDGEEPPQR